MDVNKKKLRTNLCKLEKSGSDVNAAAEPIKLKKKKVLKKNKKVRPERGVIFIKNLPHGFFEKQLKEFFKQFGRVTRLRLMRSQRTGGSRSRAFVEFAVPEVAQTAAETMQNYLMFQRVVKASYIPPEQQMFNYFRSDTKQVTNKVGKKIFISAVTKRTNKKVKEINNWDEPNYEKRTKNSLRQLRKLKSKFPDLDVNVDEIVLKPKKNSLEKCDNLSESQLSVVSSGDRNSNGESESGNDTSVTPTKTPGSLLLVKKHKNVAIKNKRNAIPKTDKDISVSCLLGESLKEEDFSSDDEYDPAQNEEENVTENETLSDSESELNSSANDSFQKQTTADNFEKVIKRGRLAGGVQKRKLKRPKKLLAQSKSAELTKMQQAAKEILKTSTVPYIKQKDLKKKKK